MDNPERDFIEEEDSRKSVDEFLKLHIVGERPVGIEQELLDLIEKMKSSGFDGGAASRLGM